MVLPQIRKQNEVLWSVNKMVLPGTVQWLAVFLNHNLRNQIQEFLSGEIFFFLYSERDKQRGLNRNPNNTSLSCSKISELNLFLVTCQTLPKSECHELSEAGLEQGY